MDDLDEALALLDGIAFRDRIAEEERIPAWRAIRLLYKRGLSENDCTDIVRAIRKLGKRSAFGPTLAYYMEGARWDLGRARRSS